MGAFGTTTAGVIAGGSVGPAAKSEVEEFNGTSWSEETNITTPRWSSIGAGTLTAGVIFGGNLGPPGMSNATEEYDGTNWTAGGNMNTARGELSGGGGPTGQTAAIAMAGRTTAPSPGSTATETYDGTTWTTSPATLAVAQAGGMGGGVGTSTATLFAGGKTGPAMGTPIVATTQEFNSSTNTITAAAWASGGNLNTARYSLGGFGATQDTAVAFAGRDTPIYQATEEYNGNSWTTVNNYPQTITDPGSCGVLTAGLGLGGLNPGSIPSFPTTGKVTGEYDGTDWTAGGSYSYDAWGVGMAGTQTAAIASGGHNYPMPPGNRNNSGEYNGASWTAGNTMSQVRALFAAGGSQTASFACGGRSSPGVEDPTNATEEYDGTNWTSGGNYIVAVKENTAGGGPQTAGYVAGGAAPSATAITGTYDGTAWSTAPSLTGVQQLNGSTTNNTGPSGAMSFGGGTDLDATYEFTVATSTANVETITTS